ncbi:hypothetical protein ACFXKG_35380 [Streptomyces sp. NPDC059255]|uniref:hypothetical protein n=1 Tax=Streptomyces sp. NPDC059255 TaxID=3346793 RepID=UPI0036BCB85F
MVHGYSVAAWFAVGLLVTAALVALAFVNASRPGTSVTPTGTGAPDEVLMPVPAH